jgi:hypothetical protein
VGWLKRAGPAESVPSEGFKMQIDFEFRMNLDFGKTLRILQGDLEGIWT